MTKRGIVCAAVVSMVLVPVVVKAGYKQAEPVIISTDAGGNTSASGAFAEARSFPNNNGIYIGCSIYGQAGYAPSIYCSARDNTNAWAGCYSTDPNLVSVVAAMTEETVIGFGGNSSGYCTGVSLGDFSYVNPSQP